MKCAAFRITNTLKITNFLRILNLFTNRTAILVNAAIQGTRILWMEQYIESSLALYDLKVNWLYYDKDHRDPYYFFETTLDKGLNIKIRSDGYYVFNFTNSTIGSPTIHKDVDNNLYVRNERVEVMHAFLACLRYLTQRKERQTHSLNMNFIDNFIICSQDNSDLEQIIGDFTLFSSDDYRKLSEEKLKRIRERRIDIEINHTEIIQNTVDIMNTITNTDEYAIYILGIFYRVAVYHNLGLEIHSVLFLQSIFEWLFQRSCYKKSKAIDYHNYLLKHKIIGDNYCIMNTLRHLRHGAIHELKFPRVNLLQNPISKSFRILEKIFCTEFNIKINIPLGQRSTNIIEKH